MNGKRQIITLFDIQCVASRARTRNAPKNFSQWVSTEMTEIKTMNN